MPWDTCLWPDHATVATGTGDGNGEVDWVPYSARQTTPDSRCASLFVFWRSGSGSDLGSRRDSMLSPRRLSAFLPGVGEEVVMGLDYIKELKGARAE